MNLTLPSKHASPHRTRALSPSLKPHSRPSLQAQSPKTPPLPPIIFMTDPTRTPNPLQIIQTMKPGWAIIHRHFGQPELIAQSNDLAKACHDNGLKLLIANDPSTAAKVNANGVHWSQTNLPTRRLPTGFQIQTTSAHDLRALKNSENRGLTAALVSPVFPSNSPSAKHILGLMRFRSLCRQTTLPIYALGGVNFKNHKRINDVTVGFAAIDAIQQLHPKARH